MNLFLTVVWTAGAVLWASAGNPWLSALYALLAGLWLGILVRDGI